MPKYKRFVVVADNHGDMQDDESVAALWSFMEDFKPHIRVHLGDNWDFRNLRKGASDDEKAHSLEDDWVMGNDFVRKFFNSGRENYFLNGNHCSRASYMVNSCIGMNRDYARDAVKRMESMFKKSRATVLPYDSALGVLTLGKLSMVHGYHAGVGAARAHAAVYGNCLFGHVHTIESSPVSSLAPAEARSIGCLCKRDMDYINAKTGKLRWANGWAYGLLFADGSYHLEQVRKINGKFYAAKNIEEIIVR